MHNIQTFIQRVVDEFVRHPLTSHVTPSFLHAKEESRTAYDLYWLDSCNQHAKNTDYDFTPLIESWSLQKFIVKTIGEDFLPYLA